MAETQKKMESESTSIPVSAEQEAPSNDVVNKNASEPETVSVDLSKAIVVIAEPETEKVPTNKLISRGSLDRDIALAEVTKEKKLSYVKAWEENQKSKAENKAQKHLSSVDAWENSKKAALEAELKKIEEKLEKKKAEYGEKYKNKIALVHKEAEEKKAVIEAKRGEEILKVEETAAKYRATGTTPKKPVGCF